MEKFCISVPIELMKIAPFVKRKCKDCGCWIGLTKATYDEVKDIDIDFICMGCFIKNHGHKEGKFKDLTEEQLKEFKDYERKLI